MQATVILCTAYILTGMADANQRTNQASDWNFQTVRRREEISNIFQSTNATSLIGCVSFCSNVVGIIVPSLYYKHETEQCTCNSATDETSEDETSEDENQPEIVHGIRSMFQKAEITPDLHKGTHVWPYKHDCAGMFEENYTQDGVYVINPPGGQITDTWCDMTNGGWTVIQRRMDGSENFYRGWNDYVNGFGNRTGEYWIGLDTLHRLTNNGSELVVYMETFPGAQPSSMTAHYSNFTIGDIDSNYTLYISGYNGTCGDSFTSHNGQQFTTFDNDNDQHVYTNCAVEYKGGWWYKNCHYANLNGKYYQTGENIIFSTGIHWFTCWTYSRSLKFAVMKIRR